MHHSHPTIEILPQKKRLKSRSGQTLFESLLTHGILLRSDCGGKGRCGKCRVDRIEKNGGLNSVESCQYKMDGDVSIAIPDSSMASPFIMDKASLLLPERFTNRGNRNSLPDAYGLAMDLGTTTIALYLCNRSKGEVATSTAVKNPQAVYGDDIMGRIGWINGNPERLGKLQSLVINAIEWGIKQLIPPLGDKAGVISRAVAVGNPTMIHILCGADPTSIGLSPYEPVFYESRVFQSGRLGFSGDRFDLYTLPNVSGFIGGDILAAGIAVDMTSQPDGTLLMDLGTNGELLLKAGEKLYATSCATGPAFEGASISCGMPAVPGAVTSIRLNSRGQVSQISVIDPIESSKIQASGICGPGVINAVARLLESSTITPDGRIASGESKFILVPADQNQSEIHISQKDIRSVQLGKSALMTGIELLLKKAGIKQPEKIIIAGTLGSHLSPWDLIQLGMIPEIEGGKIEMAGNAAGSGAVMALNDAGYFAEAIETAAKIEVVDLAAHPDFQHLFIENLGFANR